MLDVEFAWDWSQEQTSITMLEGKLHGIGVKRKLPLPCWRVIRMKLEPRARLHCSAIDNLKQHEKNIFGSLHVIGEFQGCRRAG